MFCIYIQFPAARICEHAMMFRSELWPRTRWKSTLSFYRAEPYTTKMSLIKLFQWCHSCDIQVAFRFSKLILNYAARGVVEIARYIFSVAGVEYEDYRYQIEDYGPPPKFSAVKRNMHFTLRGNIINTFACRRFLRTNTAGNWRLQWAR